MGTWHKTPAGQITLKSFGTIFIYFVYVVSLSIGFVFSVKNKLNAKITGYIGISAWFPEFIVPLLFAVYILLFFIIEERRLPYGMILLICTLSIGNLAHIMIRRLIGPYRTDLGLVVSTVHCLGKLGMVILLGYQAYIWDKKRKTAYKK